MALAKWRTKIEVAAALRPDLKEALRAYRHFLEGKGRRRTFSYEDYVRGDRSGQTTLASALLDIQDGVEIIWRADESRTDFWLKGDAIQCGPSEAYPYPATENWQKAIGGHMIWLSGKVRVQRRESAVRLFLEATLHAEDRYNFNPDQKDIATGIPDDKNGIFEITGLATQYDQIAELTRNLEWTHGTLHMGATTVVNAPRR